MCVYVANCKMTTYVYTYVICMYIRSYKCTNVTLLIIYMYVGNDISKILYVGKFWQGKIGEFGE